VRINELSGYSLVGEIVTGEDDQPRQSITAEADAFA
jgi:hypothetical protein